MSRHVFTVSLIVNVLSVPPAVASDKADIDTSPRVFASADGKYWVRVTTKREMADVNKWTTTMTVFHAEGGRGVCRRDGGVQDHARHLPRPDSRV